MKLISNCNACDLSHKTQKKFFLQKERHAMKVLLPFDLQMFKIQFLISSTHDAKFS